MKWRISEPAHLLHAVRLSLHEGGRFLRSRLAPTSPPRANWLPGWGRASGSGKWSTTPCPGRSSGTPAWPSPNTYKPLKHMVAVPPHPLEGENRLWLPGEEITGEFLGEMKAIEEGVTAWLGAEGECGAP